MKLKIFFFTLITLSTTALFSAQENLPQFGPELPVKSSQQVLNEITVGLITAYQEQKMPEYRARFDQALSYVSKETQLMFLTAGFNVFERYLNQIKAQLTQDVQASVIASICHMTSYKQENISKNVIDRTTAAIVKALMDKFFTGDKNPPTSNPAPKAQTKHEDD